MNECPHSGHSRSSTSASLRSPLSEYVGVAHFGQLRSFCRRVAGPAVSRICSTSARSRLQSPPVTTVVVNGSMSMYLPWFRSRRSRRRDVTSWRFWRSAIRRRRLSTTLYSARSIVRSSAERVGRPVGADVTGASNVMSRAISRSSRRARALHAEKRLGAVRLRAYLHLRTPGFDRNKACRPTCHHPTRRRRKYV